MRKIYVAASADTTKKIAAYAYKEQDERKITSKMISQAASPAAILKAMRAILEEERPESFEVVTNSSYLIEAITDRIYGWEAAGWFKADGNPVANQEDLKKIYSLLTGKFNNVVITMRHPETSAEKTTFQVVSSVAKAARK